MSISICWQDACYEIVPRGAMYCARHDPAAAFRAEAKARRAQREQSRRRSQAWIRIAEQELEATRVFMERMQAAGQAPREV